ncbi:MAG: zf-TFIIB domain-containing protein [Elusimicrobia bacterium]|nr:zf-TFIIB domain-containing protein [Elusimicrobiota bacterium]
MNCPRCHKPLAAVEVAGLEVDLCRDCEGVWFDGDELAAVMESQKDALKDSPVAKTWEGIERKSDNPGTAVLDCPRCGAKLERYRYQSSAPAIIDGCAKGCGVWLDDGELKKVYEHWAHSILPPTGDEKALFMEAYAKLEGERQRKEKAFVENLTTMDDQPGMKGRAGKVLQKVYESFYKLGLR